MIGRFIFQSVDSGIRVKLGHASMARLPGFFLILAFPDCLMIDRPMRKRGSQLQMLVRIGHAGCSSDLPLLLSNEYAPFGIVDGGRVLRLGLKRTSNPIPWEAPVMTTVLPVIGPPAIALTLRILRDAFPRLCTKDTSHLPGHGNTQGLAMHLNADL